MPRTTPGLRMNSGIVRSTSGVARSSNAGAGPCAESPVHGTTALRASRWYWWKQLMSQPSSSWMTRHSLRYRRRAPVLVHGEVVGRPLAIDPSDACPRRPRRDRPRRAGRACRGRSGSTSRCAAHRGTSSRRPAGGRRAARAAARRRSPARAACERRDDRRRAARRPTRTARASPPRVSALLPARRPRRRVEAQREMSGRGVDLVAAANARRTRKVVVGVGAVVTAIEIVERERVEAGAHQLPQHAHVGEDRR